MMSYLWVMIGSALGGLLRFTIGRLAIPLDTALRGFPVGTVLINIIGSFVIGYFGTLTLHNGKYPVSENMRIFVMIGICGGFTTFSSFSLQSFDLARSGAWGRALANVILSIVLCLAAVAAGHRLAQHSPTDVAIAETAEEEYTG
jgi:CrcB protein